MVAGSTPVLVHNCDLALGWQKAGTYEWAESKAGWKTLKNYPTAGSAMAGARKAIADANVTLHVNLRQLPGGFLGAATRGLQTLEETGKPAQSWATDEEMAYIAMAVKNGQRSWDSVNFYDGPDWEHLTPVKIDQPEWDAAPWSGLSMPPVKSFDDYCSCS